MRALLLGVSNPNHSRSLQLERMLNEQYESVEKVLWHGPKVGVSNFNAGMSGFLLLIASAFQTLPRLWWRVLMTGFKSTVLISHPSQLNLLCVFHLVKFLKQKVIVDYYVSLADTLVRDRGLLIANGIKEQLLTKIDKFTLKHADVVIFDTQTNMQRTRREHPTIRFKGQTLYPDPIEAFKNSRTRQPAYSEKRDVLFYGNFSPLMGVEVVSKAFASPRLSHLQLTLVGYGQDSENRKISTFDTNVKRLPQVPPESVPALLINHKLSLGVFGNSEKAASVFPNKVIESLMTSTPCITRKGEISENFGDIGCFFINPGEPDELIEAILQMTNSRTILERYRKRAFAFSETWDPRISLRSS